jgi:hypothetical protein
MQTLNEHETRVIRSHQNRRLLVLLNLALQLSSAGSARCIRSVETRRHQKFEGAISFSVTPNPALSTSVSDPA